MDLIHTLGFNGVVFQSLMRLDGILQVSPSSK